MNIESLFIKRITIDKDFDYKFLYNDNRGAVYKDEYKSLIRQAITKKVINVEKYIIAENVQDQLYQIGETRGLQYTLIECLKDYHNEPDYVIAPLVYFLRKLDPQLKINTNDEIKIESKIVDFEICPRIDGMNAKPRIFLPKEKVAIASTNDNIDNLGDILAVKDVKVYVIGTDNRSNTIYAYKIERNESFFAVAEGYKDRRLTDLF